ncbi:hypothetical protein CVV67_10790 [Arthrobacter stackebrandtii]|nr:hypothetical protein CVV67_10790 [Arthrobacter stackebrandtii]
MDSHYEAGISAAVTGCELVVTFPYPWMRRCREDQLVLPRTPRRCPVRPGRDLATAGCTAGAEAGSAVVRGRAANASVHMMVPVVHQMDNVDNVGGLNCQIQPRRHHRAQHPEKAEP